MELLKFRAVYIKIIVKNTSADLRHCDPPLTGATRLLLPGSSCQLSALVQPAPAKSASPPLCEHSTRAAASSLSAHKGPFSSFSPPAQSSFCRLCAAFPSTPNHLNIPLMCWWGVSTAAQPVSTVGLRLEATSRSFAKS